MEDALLKIDMLMSGSNQPVLVDHTDITGEIDKLLAIVAGADEKLAKLRRFYGSNIEQGVIMVCTPDLYFQEFRFEGDQMRHYRHKFLERLSQFKRTF